MYKKNIKFTMVKAKTKTIKAEEVPKSKKLKKTETSSDDSSSEEEVEVAKKVNGKKANGKANGMHLLVVNLLLNELMIL